MKTVIDAVNKFNGEWPYSRDESIIESKGCFGFLKGELSNLYSHKDCLNTTRWSFTCTRKEFNQCVDEMSKAEWIKPVTLSPVYTQEMADNGELPLVGMECLLYNKLDSSDCSPKIIIDFINDNGALIRYDDSGLNLFLTDYDRYRFKPITPPIELIDGKAYQFEARGKTVIGVYDKGDKTFNIHQGYYFDLVSVTNIQLLEVKS